MNLNCSARMIKYLMIFFNFIFVITGIVLVVIGASVKAIYGSYDEFLDGQYFSLPNMLIATGSIIFIISLCGCCGALKESWLLTGIFTILLIVIFIFELSIGIAGYVLRGKTYDYLHDELKSNLGLYNSNHSFVMTAWDLIQIDFECCGVDNYTDWNGVFHNDRLPVSCCPRKDGTVGEFYCNANFKSRVAREADIIASPQVEINATVNSTNVANPENPQAAITANLTAESPSNATNSVTTAKPEDQTSSTQSPITESPATTISPSTSDPYQTGCADAFSTFIKTHVADLAAAGMVLAVIQVLGIAFAFYLTKQLRSQCYST